MENSIIEGGGVSEGHFPLSIIFLDAIASLDLGYEREGESLHKALVPTRSIVRCYRIY